MRSNLATLDRAPTAAELRARLLAAKTRFARSRRAEIRYAQQLRAVARHVGGIIRGFAPDGTINPPDLSPLLDSLRKYSALLTPWARAVSGRMLAEVGRRDASAWEEHGREMGLALRAELRKPYFNSMFSSLLDEQVDLITSLPTEAAERVNKLAVETLYTGGRGQDIKREIMRSGEVTEARATLIARTEVGRAAAMTQAARAIRLGSTHYEWVTAHDADVRPLHKKLEGQIFSWDAPPITGEKGERSLPGAIYNCFPGDTPVNLSSGCWKLWRSFYNGEMVKVTTSLGSLEATFNHPVLTTRGWIAIGDVQAGDDLIQVASHSLDVHQANDDQVLPTFDDMYRTFGCSGNTESGLKFNFHGQVPESDVDEIPFGGMLPGDRVSAEFERLSEIALAYADGRIARSGVVSGLCHVGETDSAPIGDQGAALIGIELGHADIHGVAAASGGDSALTEDASNDATCGAESFGERELAFATHVRLGDVAFRKIIDSVRSGPSSPRYHHPVSPEALAEMVSAKVNDVRGEGECFPGGYERLRVLESSRREFSGHVFTIQSTTGWYSVTRAGIVAKNCRCIASPILPDRR